MAVLLLGQSAGKRGEGGREGGDDNNGKESGDDKVET